MGVSGLPKREVHAGQVWWAAPSPTIGREQGGRRPVLIVSGELFQSTVTTLALGVPITSVDRGWLNHVAVGTSAGLRTPSWAMTEQVRAISRERLQSLVGTVSESTLTDVRRWIRDYLTY